MIISLTADGRLHTSMPSILHGLTPASAAIMADTRSRLFYAMASLEISITDQARDAINSALSSATRRAMAPFMSLSPLQRLAFLDEIRRIPCARPFPDHAPVFFPGCSYPVTTVTLTVRNIESRRNPNMPGGYEEVRVQYRELATILRDSTRHHHAFLLDTATADALPTKAAHIHPIADLLTHFPIPDVPDIASLFPHRFHNLKQKLAAL